MSEKFYDHWAWKLLAAVILCLMAWVFISWVEVCLKNTSPDPQYSTWNFLVLLLQ